DQLEVGAVGMLDQHRAGMVGPVLDRVGLGLATAEFGLDDPLDYFHFDQLVGVGVLGFDLGPQVHGVADETNLIGAAVVEAGVASVGAAFEDGDRALVDVQGRAVLELQTQEWELGVDLLVVDRDLLAADHRLVDDRDQGRLLPGQAYRLSNRILEMLAQLGRRGGAGDALMKGDGLPVLPAADPEHQTASRSVLGWWQPGGSYWCRRGR